MKKQKRIALALAGLLLAGVSYGQMGSPFAFTSASIRDNPGTLGHTYTELDLSLLDFSEDEVDADGYTLGLRGSTPVAPGVDVGLGYRYFRENDHFNPFDDTVIDPSYHRLSTSSTFYTRTGMTKAFLGGSVSYQWANDDFAGLRTYDDQWFFGVTGGLEIGMGTFSLTPRITYTDTFDDIDLSAWHYGAELHTWFTEGAGGYLGATYHDPDRRELRPDSWSYTAGVRFRY